MKNLISLLSVLISLNTTYATQSDSMDIHELKVDSNLLNQSGAFLLYDLNSDRYFVYNLARAKSYYPAHSTSKMLISIAALEQGIVKEPDSVSWDSLKNKRQDWWAKEPYNHWSEHQNIVSALKYSVNWYYIDLIKKMDMQQTKNMFDRYDFGTIPDTLYPHYFFISNNIYTSAFKEVDFLKRLYLRQLEISDTTRNIILKALLAHSDADYKLYYKTGFGPVDDAISIGWLVGIIENGNNRYFFALNIDEPNSATPPMVQLDLAEKLNGILEALKLNHHH